MSNLYQEYFGLSKSPFQITPDIDYFFSGSRRGDILTALLHVASHEEGIVTIVAEVGSGKTLLSRLLLSRLPERTCTVYLSNPCFTREEIISAIARDLGLTDLPATLEGKIAALHQELLSRYAQGWRVLLVIDEAHAMPAESLEEVRLLSNLETAQHKLLNIMLFGQPELDAVLAEPRLRQLRDRVIHRFELLPFSNEDGAAYLDHRLRVAGWQGGKLFTSAAEKLLMQASGGRARRINLLADKALLGAYSEGLKQVDKRHVQRARVELHDDPVVSGRNNSASTAAIPWGYVLGLGLSLALVLTAAALWLLGGSVRGVGTNVAPAVSIVPVAPVASVARPIGMQAGTVLASDPVASKHIAPPVLPVQQTTVSEDVRGTVDKPASPFEQAAVLLKNPAVSGFTLQLATLKVDDDLKHYMSSLAQSIDSKLIFAHNGSGQEGHYVAVYVGQYETKEAARAALEQLPATLKVNQPLIRTWARIRQEAALQP